MRAREREVEREGGEERDANSEHSKALIGIRDPLFSFEIGYPYSFLPISNRGSLFQFKIGKSK